MEVLFFWLEILDGNRGVEINERNSCGGITQFK